MLKYFVSLNSIILLISVVAYGCGDFQKATPEETVRKFWQYVLDENCKGMDALFTSFSGYEKDRNGRLYTTSAEVNPKADKSNVSHCENLNKIAELKLKLEKILSIDVNEELQKAKVIILTKSDDGISVKYRILLTKSDKKSEWKIFSYGVDSIEN